LPLFVSALCTHLLLSRDVEGACCGEQLTGHQKTMNGTAILNTASNLIETYGDGAKFHIAEQMDRALEAGDGATYDHLALVAKAVVLMTMTRQEAAVAKPEKVVAPQPLRAFKAA